MYRVVISGVQDLVGNVISGSFTYSFTTGSNPLLTAPVFVQATVLVNNVATPLVASNNVSNAQANTPITVAYGSPLDPNSILPNGIHLVVSSTQVAVPFTWSLSADARTITIKPTSTLSSATKYEIDVSYFARLSDQAGNAPGASLIFYFTTQ